MHSVLTAFVLAILPIDIVLSSCHVTYVNETNDVVRQDCNQDNYYYSYVRKYGTQPSCRSNYYSNIDICRGYYQCYIYHENTTINATITCLFLSSIKEISYEYTDQEYEQFLKIENSNISTISPNALLSFTTITTLHLSGNHIKIIKPAAFNGLSKLRELYLDNNEITAVLNTVFNPLHRLEILNLTNNRLTQIDHLAFMGVANLAILHMRNNNLSRIEDDLFETQHHLKYLDLSRNPIEELSLTKVTSLETVLLTGSRLSDFEDLSNFTMKLLDLSSSQLSAVDFSYYPKVDKLLLSKNQIQSLENCDVLHSTIIYLNDNSLTTINGTFSNLSEIYLAHNQLERLQSTLLNNSSSLRVIDFSSNKIKFIDKNLFQRCRSLKTLLLGENKIDKIDPILFRDLVELTFLNLSHNRIEEFQYGTFDSLPSLQILDISDNRLLDLHQYTFHSLSNLFSLKFDNNRISSFDVQDLGRHLPELQSVSLDHNPWNCKELVEIERYLKSMNVFVSGSDNYDVENIHGIACVNEKGPVATVSASGLSAKELAGSLQKALDQGVKSSKISDFFSGGFKESKFFEYFDKDYERSNFFKFLHDFKFVTVKQDSNDTKAEKFTSVQMLPSEKSTGFHVLVVILLFSVLLSLLFISYLLMRKPKFNSVSQIELC